LSSKLKGEIFRPLACWQFDLQIENGNLVSKSVWWRVQFGTLWIRNSTWG